MDIGKCQPDPPDVDGNPEGAVTDRRQVAAGDSQRVLAQEGEPLLRIGGIWLKHREGVPCPRLQERRGVRSRIIGEVRADFLQSDDIGIEPGQRLGGGMESIDLAMIGVPEIERGDADGCHEVISRTIDGSAPSASATGSTGSSCGRSMIPASAVAAPTTPQAR